MIWLALGAAGLVLLVVRVRAAVRRHNRETLRHLTGAMPWWGKR